MELDERKIDMCRIFEAKSRAKRTIDYPDYIFI